MRMIKILINSRDNIDNLNFFDQRFSISKSLNYDFFFEKNNINMDSIEYFYFVDNSFFFSEIKGNVYEENHDSFLNQILNLTKLNRVFYFKKEKNNFIKNYSLLVNDKFKINLDNFDFELEVIKIFCDAHNASQEKISKFLKWNFFSKNVSFLLEKKEFLDFYEKFTLILTNIKKIFNFDIDCAFIRWKVFFIYTNFWFFLNFEQTIIKELNKINFININFDCENSFPIVLTVNDNYIKYCSVLIESLVQNVNKETSITIFLIVVDVIEWNLEKIVYMMEKAKNFHLKIIDGKYFLKKIFGNWKNENLVYLRFYIFEILKKYDKVLYLDSDIVVNSDISELINFDIKKKALAAAIDTTYISRYFLKKSNQYINSYEILKIKDPFLYFNAGVLLLNPKYINELINIEDLYNLCKNNKYVWKDQDILNKLFHEHFLILDSKWNFLVSKNTKYKSELIENILPSSKIYDNYFSSRISPNILHFVNKSIPSLSRNLDKSHIFWKYARETPFYEEILSDFLKNYQKKENKLVNFIISHKFLYKIAKKIKKIIKFKF